MKSQRFFERLLEVAHTGILYWTIKRILKTAQKSLQRLYNSTDFVKRFKLGFYHVEGSGPQRHDSVFCLADHSYNIFRSMLLNGMIEQAATFTAVTYTGLPGCSHKIKIILIVIFHLFKKMESTMFLNLLHTLALQVRNINIIVQNLAPDVPQSTSVRTLQCSYGAYQPFRGSRLR